VYVREKFKRNNREDLKGDLGVDKRLHLKPL